MYQLSIEGCKNLLGRISGYIEELKKNNSYDQNMLAFKRDVHTLKGDLRMYGNNRAGALAHRIESVIEYLEVNRLDGGKLFLDFLEIELNRLIFLSENDEQLSEAEALWINGEVDSVRGRVDNVDIKPLDLSKDIRVSSKLLDSLIDESSELRLTIATLKELISNTLKTTKELSQTSTKAQKIIKEIELKAETQINAISVTSGDAVDYDPLEYDRFTRLQELTKFMHETIEDINSSVKSINTVADGFDKGISKQLFINNSILDKLMGIRLVPVSSVSDKFYRVTRRAAQDSNKTINLHLSGERNEVDRVVLEKVQHSIDHILRNCVAHGIESREDRLAKGKGAVGNISIDIKVDGSFVVFTVSDDGGGIDVNKVRKKAIENNLITANDKYDDQEIIDLVFNPGFSTAEKVTEEAGRGIGLDVVRSEIIALGGSVSIKTKKDVGTNFIIAVPLSVVINQVMLTYIDSKLFAIPAALIEEVLSVDQDTIEEAYKKGCMSYRGKEVKLYYIGDITGENKDRKIGKYNTVVCVNYMDHVGNRVMLHIDNFKSIEEVVIKSAGNVIGKVSGIIGLATLGDGEQGVVINPSLLVMHYDKYIKNENIQHITNQDKRKKKIMVVDDSVTIRIVTSKFLEKIGYEVVLAKDGQDAITKLSEDNMPDVILSDIEMPVMSGFDFLRHLKSKEEYSSIPVIMITSRTANKHRRDAFDLGASGYIGKPYHENELELMIKELIYDKNKVFYS